MSMTPPIKKDDKEEPVGYRSPCCQKQAYNQLVSFHPRGERPFVFGHVAACLGCGRAVGQLFKLRREGTYNGAWAKPLPEMTSTAWAKACKMSSPFKRFNFAFSDVGAVICAGDTQYKEERDITQSGGSNVSGEDEPPF